MPGSRQDRFILAKEIRGQRAVPSDAAQAQDTVRFFLDLAKQNRRKLQRFAERFTHIPGATAVDRRTAYFDGITSASTGSIELLHDIGEALDTLFAFVNDFRNPSDPILEQPFTDANITYYEANGVSD